MKKIILRFRRGVIIILEDIKEKIVNKLKNINHVYDSFYSLSLLEQNNRLYIVDEFEEFYYGGQDFDNCLEDITNALINIINDEDLYLECEVPSRWVIVSDKLNKLMDEYKMDVSI